MSSRSSSILPAPAYGDAVRAWYDAADTLLQPWREALQASRTRLSKEPTPCPGHCDCCVPDADILVHARAGERRVVPLLLTNPGRRPLTVTVAVDAFSRCGSSVDVDVDARVVPATEVELEACGRATIHLVLDIGSSGAPSADERPQGATADGEDAVAAIRSGKAPQRRDEHCCTLVGDVRFVGCGSRAVRIGLIVLPASCDAYDVRCDCGCC